MADTNRKKLIPVTQLFGKAFKIFFEKENFVHVMKFVGVQLGLLAITGVPGVILFGLATQGQTSSPALPIILFAALFIIAAVVVSILTSLAFVYAVNQVVEGKFLGVKETFLQAWSKVASYFLASVLVGLLVLVGLVLLVIPAIIFAIWFFYATYFVALKGVPAGQSLGKSRELVSGYFWPVLVRFGSFAIFGAILSMVLNLIPIIGPIISFLTTPFFVLLHILLFKDLESVKE